AVVARRIGERRPDAASEAAVQGIALGLGVAAVVAAVGITLAPRLLAVMGASPAVTAIGSGYTRMLLGGSATVLLLFLINAIFRGAGDAAIAMRVLWLANAINILLGPCLIFGLGPFPRLGVTGAAVATTIGRGTGVLYQLYRLTRGDARVAVRRIHLALRPAVMATLLRLSGSGNFQVLAGPAHHQLRLPVLRAGDGAHPVVQRGGGHLDADLDQPRLLLAVGDPARLRAREGARLRAGGRVPRDHGGVLDPRAGLRRAVPA